MNIILNGESKQFISSLSVQALLVAMGVDARKVAVELGGAILPKSRYAETLLKEGDQLEIIGFIGGG